MVGIMNRRNLFLKHTSGGKNLDNDALKEFAPNIVDGVAKLKAWSSSL